LVSQPYLRLSVPTPPTPFELVEVKLKAFPPFKI
jgi:hypothetical protein